jgi:predicted dehydrogenase
MTSQKSIRLGMVGGGPGAGIGPAHRYGARMDGAFDLVAGCFSRDSHANAEMGRELGLDPERIYPDWQSMAAAEGKRDDGIRALSIVTPNDSHVPISLAFINEGVHIICDKPLATSFADAAMAHRAARSRGLVFALTHIYASYAMAREARERIAAGELGELRMIQIEYASGGRAKLVEAQGDAKSQWRLTPSIAGPSSVLGDIGTHAHHLARFMTGLELEAVSADIHTVVKGRRADDNAHVNLRFLNGVTGQLWASYAASGFGNGLRIRIFGDRGGLEWAQERPDELWIRPIDESQRLLRRGEAGLSPAAAASSRMRIGHPQGILEAFANFYNDVAVAIKAVDDGAPADGMDFEFATSRDGVLGMKFVEAAVASNASAGSWVGATVDFASLEGEAP